MPVKSNKNCLIRVSYRGFELAVVSNKKKGEVRILNGSIVKQERTEEKSIEFQIPVTETEVRLALVAPYAWILVNEKTGDGYTSDVIYPNCKVKIELPLTRRSY